jgi:uncharacterized membrane protein HdeD (DUF308 family)
MPYNTKELTGGMKAAAIIAFVLMIGLGIFLFFNLWSVIWLFSAAVVVNGIFLVARYFSMKEERNGWDIISGAIYILFAAAMLFGGTESRVLGVVTIEIFIAIWAIFAGFSNTFTSLEKKKQGDKGWCWSLIGGIITIICGILLLAMPLMGAFVLVSIAGIHAGIAFVAIGLTGLAAVLSKSGGEPDVEESA